MVLRHRTPHSTGDGWRRAARWARYPWLAVLWLTLALPAQAAAPLAPTPPGGPWMAEQSAGLLVNSGFEGGSSNDTLTDRYDVNGNYIESLAYTEVIVPDGWRAFYRSGKPAAPNPNDPIGWSRPEVRVVTNIPPHDARRVYAGTQAVMLFTFWKIHDAGFYQQVAVSPGARYRLSGWVHSWTTNDDLPVSSGDPYQAWQYLGLDPTGATNPFASTVVWSDPAHIYDVYAQPQSVEVVAQSTTLTVFLRSWVKWAVKHNDMYWDEIRLVEVTRVYVPMLVVDEGNP